jgi:predicted heme/steroid binding protein
MTGAERKFTLEELKQYDGRDGRPAYIAYKGKVYDVTDSFLWIDGVIIKANMQLEKTSQKTWLWRLTEKKP